jgi:hypothetical protein
MKRVMALLLLAALPGCGGMPIDGTDPLNVVVPCNTAYYNSQFGFGFDLPSTAILRNQGNEPTLLFDASWSLAPSVEAAIGTAVGEFPTSLATLDDEYKLLAFAASRHESFAASPNTEYFTDMSVTLPNGDLGYMVIMATDVACLCDADDRNVVWDVMTVKHNRVYWVFGNTSESLYTDATHDVVARITLSLCVD